MIPICHMTTDEEICVLDGGRESRKEHEMRPVCVRNEIQVEILVVKVE